MVLYSPTKVEVNRSLAFIGPMSHLLGRLRLLIRKILSNLVRIYVCLKEILFCQNNDHDDDRDPDPDDHDVTFPMMMIRMIRRK